MAFDYIQSLNRGGGGGGARLADMLMQMTQQQQQLNSAGKSADYARKAMGDDAAANTGITDDEWDNLGSKDKVSAMQGYQTKTTLANLLAQTRLTASRTAAMDQQTQQQQDDAQTQQQQQGADQRFTGMMTNKVPTDQSIMAMFSGQGPVRNQTTSTNDILQAGLQSGVTPDVAIRRAASIGALNGTAPGAGGTAGGNNFFSADPDKMAQDVPGFPGLKRVITGPKTSILRDANGNVAQPMTDEDGNPIGYGVPSGTGTSKFVPISQTTPKGQVTDQDTFKAGAVAHAARVRDAGIDVHNFSSIGDTKSAGYTNAVAGYNQALKEQDDFLSGKSNKSPASKAATPAVAQTYLQKYGGDKAKARAAAKADGYSF